jgi:hypothetical protein
MAHISHHVLLDVFKKVFGEVDEAMFRDVERPLELNLCNLSIEKGDLNGRL